MWAWTTRLLFTLLVILLCLWAGRETLQWWRSDVDRPADRRPPLTVHPLGDPQTPHILQLGPGPWTARRQELRGGDELARQTLAGLSREVIAGAAPAGPTPTAAEQQFLAMLAQWKPLETGSGGWRLYAVPGPFPIVVGTRPAAVAGRSTVAVSAYRMVTWGLALPMAEKAWTLYVFYSDPGGSAAGSRLPDVPLPPESRRALAVRAADGSAIITFNGLDVGAGPPEGWMAFYDRWSRENAWKVRDDWRQAGESWRSRRTSPDGRRGRAAAVARAARPVERVDCAIAGMTVRKRIVHICCGADDSLVLTTKTQRHEAGTDVEYLRSTIGRSFLGVFVPLWLPFSAFALRGLVVRSPFLMPLSS